MSEQLAFSRLLVEADEQPRAALDRVQAWFDELPISHKDRLADLMATFEFDICVTLSAAAGDWSQTRRAANGNSK